jgi:hypothetical protein
MTPEDNLAKVREHVEALGEFFDTVQIFVTRDEDHATHSVHLGAGNWFARLGQVTEWVTKEDECSRSSVHKEDEQ